MVERLGLIKPSQALRAPTQALREIDRYGPRERKAFDEFARFSVPKGYQWQELTEASRFLLALHADPSLQDLYARAAEAALADPRFAGLTERERALLRTRESGAIQVAAKGLQGAHSANHGLIVRILTEKRAAASVLACVRAVPRREARESIGRWASEQGLPIQWTRLDGDIGFVNRNYVYPWTGVYISNGAQRVITVVGNTSGSGGVLCVDDVSITRFAFGMGSVRWAAGDGNPHSGFLRCFVNGEGSRAIVGRIWPTDKPIPAADNVSAVELDPRRASLMPRARSTAAENLGGLAGEYVLQLPQRPAVAFVLSADGLAIDGARAASVAYERGTLKWNGGRGSTASGSVTMLLDPITNCPEFFGLVEDDDTGAVLRCHGSGLVELGSAANASRVVPPDDDSGWAWARLASVARAHRPAGGLFLWHKWEKHSFTSAVVNRSLSRVI